MVTPSGEAVEMVKVSGLYETYDAENSSYLRLKFDTAQNAWILTATNGTQFIYGQTLVINPEKNTANPVLRFPASISQLMSHE